MEWHQREPYLMIDLEENERIDVQDLHSILRTGWCCLPSRFSTVSNQVGWLTQNIMG